MTDTHAHPAAPAPGTAPEIDAGMRSWYTSCRCCLSDAHPEVVAILDAERDAAEAPHASAGICEVAEAVPSEQKEEVTVMAQILDPVCDMIVEVEQQRQKGLTSDLLGKTYAFCGPGCKRAFDKDPGKFTAKVSAWEASGAPGTHEHGGHTPG
jgi:YHS domain-containing protein